MFRPDGGGSTFFFIDMDYSAGVKGAYWEIARELCFWQNTSHILLSEHQLWVNLNRIKGWHDINLSVGTEVEFSNNFVAKGFYVIPTLAAKWTF